MYWAQHMAVMAFALWGFADASRRFSSTICAALSACGSTEVMLIRFV